MEFESLQDQVYSLPDSRRSMTIGVSSSKPSTMERQTQTELWLPKWRQLFYCLVGDMAFRFVIHCIFCICFSVLSLSLTFWLFMKWLLYNFCTILFSCKFDDCFFFERVAFSSSFSLVLLLIVDLC